MAFVSSAFERKIIPLRDERGALFIRDRNYGHHEISRGRRGRSRRILPSRPDCLNGISKICWKIDSRANVRTDTQPPGHGSEPHLDFIVTDLDGMLAQLCGPDRKIDFLAGEGLHRAVGVFDDQILPRFYATP